MTIHVEKPVHIRNEIARFCKPCGKLTKHQVNKETHTCLTCHRIEPRYNLTPRPWAGV